MYYKSFHFFCRLICRLFFLDAELPVMKDCPANQTLSVNIGESTVTAEWRKPTATDNSGVIPTVTCDLDVGSQFNIGRSVVQCTAYDASGNQAVCEFIIDVIGKLFFFFLSCPNTSYNQGRKCWTTGA